MLLNISFLLNQYRNEKLKTLLFLHESVFRYFTAKYISYFTFQNLWDLKRKIICHSHSSLYKCHSKNTIHPLCHANNILTSFSTSKVLTDEYWYLNIPNTRWYASLTIHRYWANIILWNSNRNILFDILYFFYAFRLIRF